MDDMNRKYVVDGVKVALACLALLLFTSLTVACICTLRPIGIVFAAADVIYFYFAAQNFAVVHVSGEGVGKYVLGKCRLHYSWDEIGEMGSVSDHFIYVSAKEMTDDDRSLMCYDWPPKDIIYFRAGRKEIDRMEVCVNAREQLFVRYYPKRFYYI